MASRNAAQTENAYTFDHQVSAGSSLSLCSTTTAVRTRKAKVGKARSSDTEIEQTAKDVAPPAKRVKTSKSAEAKLLASRKSLSMFVDMPLDVLSDIFKLLNPKDLVSLSDTSVMFRRTLCAPNMAFIWRESRQREFAPECPSKMTEYDWAAMLFATVCMNCGKNGIKDADFYIRRRLCKACKESNLVIEGQIRGIDDAVYVYCPYTRLGGKGRSHRVDYFWRGDIEEVRVQLKRLQGNANKGLDGAAQALEEHRNSRKQLISDYRNTADQLSLWQLDKKERLRLETDEMFNIRYQEVQRRFTDLGYLPGDIGLDFRMHKLVRQKTRLTENMWQRILALFGPQIAENKKTRLQHVANLVKINRRDVVEKLYADYKLTLPHAEWANLPTVFNICKLEPFAALIEEDTSIAVTDEDFRPIVDNLSQLLTSAYEAAKACLRERVVAAMHPMLEGTESTQMFQNVQLALMVFHCKCCSKYVLGFESIKRHVCSPVNQGLSRALVYGHCSRFILPDTEFPYTFQFIPEACQIIACFIDAVGLDPKSATVGDLDEKDRRVRCRECARGRPDSLEVQVSHSFQSLVNHTMQLHKGALDSNVFSGCDLIPREHMSYIKRREDEVLQAYSHNTWACTHCTEYLAGKDPADKTEILEHVKIFHNVADPQENVDLVVIHRSRSYVSIAYRVEDVQPI